ncbi:hypothetical protein HYH03_017383 [Edaphochlamys debaryana]|uniref:Protein kinase domain-containing protein n=1 Tax=Edaphochlamys debaryana TaxID=47281 RepID=A0A835XJ71_9CHLO|nr:hypothetical protein HYH03_017383 [Edaphochlamys debaryana]|eukprot:KAG2483788.1 hypothetical protein HYH03_017383 [Edaphochlamys debaryana]
MPSPALPSSDIALAIAAGVDDIVVPNDVSWTDEDWTGIDTPVVIRRNLTVRGVRREDGRLPVWDSGYVSGKHLVNTSFVCDDYFSLECIERLGTLGCYNVWPNYTALVRSPEPSPPPPPAAADGSGGDTSTGAIVGGVVGGVVGGLLLAVLVVWVVLLRRRRSERARSGSAEAAKSIASGAEGAVAAQGGEQQEALQLWPGAAAPRGAASGLPPVRELSGAESGDMEPSLPSKEAFGVTSEIEAAVDEEPRGAIGPTDPAEPGAPASDANYALLRIPSRVPAFSSGNTDFEGAMEMAVVTLATPQRVAADAEVLLDPRVSLLPDRVLGKGSFGRVLEGRYQGRAVAVKLLHDDNFGIGAMPMHAAGPHSQSVPGPTPDGTPAESAPGEPAGAPVAATEANSTAAVSVDEAATEGVVALEEIGLEEDEGQGLPTFLHEPYENLAQEGVEVEVLGRCKHPNVVELLAACLTPPRCALVMELCDTSLERLMYGSPGNLLPMDTVFDVANDVARGLHYLHPTIVHRDLKPGNVLINKSPAGRRVTAKLAPAYMAPELFDINNFAVSHKADVFSFGVLLWAMLSGQEPWKGTNCIQVAHAVLLLQKRLPYSSIPPARRHPRLMSLISSCWDHDPRRRPAAADVLKLLFLAQEEHQLAEKAAADGGERPSPPPPLVAIPAPSQSPPTPPRVLHTIKQRVFANMPWAPARAGSPTMAPISPMN